MNSMHDKKDSILSYESKLANKTAAQIIDKPKLSFWMILIPVIFVFYFYKLQQFAAGKKGFVENIMLARQQALDEAVASLELNRKANIKHLVEMSNVPDTVETEYSQWINILLNHYLELLQVDGDSFETLVKTRYKDRGAYLLFLNRLNNAEKRFNHALLSQLEQSVEGSADVIQKMERTLENFRREDAKAIFT